MEQTIEHSSRIGLCSLVLQADPEVIRGTKTFTRSARSFVFLLCDTNPSAVLIKTPTGKLQRCAERLDSAVTKAETIFLTFSYQNWDTITKRTPRLEKQEIFIPLAFDAKQFLLSWKDNNEQPRVKDLITFLFEQRFIGVKENGVLLDPDQPLSWPNNTIQLEFQAVNKVVESIGKVLREMQHILDNNSETPIVLQQLRALTTKMSLLIKSREEPVFEHQSSGGSTSAVTIAAPGLTMNVPAGASDYNYTFKVESAPPEKQQSVETLVPESVHFRASPIYHLGPHNIEFKIPLELEFSVDKSLDASKAAIYVQQEKEQHNVLNAWLILKPKRKTEVMVSIKAKSLCFMFVAPEIESVEGSTTGSNLADVIRPGLNYRGKCKTENCDVFDKFVTFHRGYGDGIKPILEKESILCPKCSCCFLSRQIVFCSTVFKINYEKKYGNDGLKTIEDQVVGRNLFLIGDPTVEEDTLYNSFSIDCKTSVYTPAVGSNTVDADAAVDGAFTGYSILIGSFIGEVTSCFDTNAGAGLKKKGFNYTVVQDEHEFAQKLPSFHIAWVISNNSLTNASSELSAACLTHHLNGKGLYIWGDNDPYFVQANIVLNEIFPGVQLVGDTPGGQNLTLSYTLISGTFLPSHIITTGVPALCEGYTISYPSIVTSFKVLAQSSNGHPCIMYADKNNGKGRVVIDCGFTKLYHNWDSIGTPRYTNNAACWLAGFSDSSQCYFV